MNIDFSRLNVHVENLVPGVVILAISTWQFDLDLSGLREQDAWIWTITFAGVAYMAGVIGNIAAYFLLNHVSQQTIRPRMLYYLRPGEFRDGPTLSKADINARYSRAVDSGAGCAVVRVQAEIEKRRQTGRILRSSLIPALMTVYALLRKADCDWPLVLLGLVLTYSALLVLYAFAEFVLFKECTRAERILRTQSQLPREVEG